MTKHIYTLAMNLVTLKCQYLNGNNSVNSASVDIEIPYGEWCGSTIDVKKFHSFWVKGVKPLILCYWVFLTDDGYADMASQVGGAE
jgi:hypothetical protein